jgi:hypothetical protein
MWETLHGGDLLHGHMLAPDQLAAFGKIPPIMPRAFLTGFLRLKDMLADDGRPGRGTEAKALATGRDDHYLDEEQPGHHRPSFLWDAMPLK